MKILCLFIYLLSLEILIASDMEVPCQLHLEVSHNFINDFLSQTKGLILVMFL